MLHVEGSNPDTPHPANPSIAVNIGVGAERDMGIDLPLMMIDLLS